MVNAFFCRSIIGGPMTVFLGERVTKRQARTSGLRIQLDSRRRLLPESWVDRAMLTHIQQSKGVPLRRPTAIRFWLEQRALILVAGSIALFLSTLAIMGAALWML
jgi:hypothetical protein